MRPRPDGLAQLECRICVSDTMVPCAKHTVLRLPQQLDAFAFEAVADG